MTLTLDRRVHPRVEQHGGDEEVAERGRGVSERRKKRRERLGDDLSRKKRLVKILFLPFVCLSAYLFVCLSVYLSIFPFDCLLISLSIHLSVYSSLCLLISLATHLSVCSSFYSSLCLPISLCTHLSVYCLPFLSV
jgi:hypothetical protein